MQKNLSIAFFGTSTFAVHVLEELLDAGVLPAVCITAPDRPAGRGLALTPPPLKVFAEKKGIDVLQPEDPKGGVFLSELGNSEWDLFIVAAYGAILPQALLDLPRLGTLNIHPSLLPKLRGASPVRSAILTNAKDAVGISVMKLDAKMDHGPILAQARIELEDWPLKTAFLEELLAREGGRLLAEVLPEYLSGKLVPEPQDDSQATFCAKFSPKDAEIDLSGDPAENYQKIMAFDGNPSAHFFAERDGKKIRMKITGAEYADGKLRITSVIPEGKKEMAYEAFLKSL